MRVLLLEDHEYPVNQVAGRVGTFAKRVGGNILRYPSGTMVEVGADRRMIIAGQYTEHRLMDKPGAWIELITRDEADKENESLHIDLNNSFDYCKGLEDRARDAEHEARQCRSELMKLYTDLLDTQASFKRMANRIADVGVMYSDRMEAPACTEASAQAQQEDC